MKQKIASHGKCKNIFVYFEANAPKFNSKLGHQVTPTLRRIYWV